MLATMSDKSADASAVAEDATGSASAAAPRAMPKSFDKLVADHQDQITRLVHRLLGWSGDVEDVVQDVFVDALKSYSNFHGRSRAITWFTRIAINRCRSHQRRRWIRRMLPLPQSEHTRFASGSRGGEREAFQFQIESQETSSQVHAAIRQLKQTDRELIVLRYLEEQSIDEIAHTLGKSTGAVNVRLNRARARLEKILAPILNC